MIEARLEAVNVETQDKLRRLLNGEMFGVLTRLAEAHVTLHQVNALKNATGACKGAPLKMEAADANLKVAAKYSTFIDVLTEFKEQKTPYQSVKLSY